MLPIMKSGKDARAWRNNDFFVYWQNSFQIKPFLLFIYFFWKRVMKNLGFRLIFLLPMNEQKTQQRLFSKLTFESQVLSYKLNCVEWFLECVLRTITWITCLTIFLSLVLCRLLTFMRFQTSKGLLFQLLVAFFKGWF